jgi:hypothetical protein
MFSLTTWHARGRGLEAGRQAEQKRPVMAKELKAEGAHNVEMKEAGWRAQACVLFHWPQGGLPNEPVPRQHAQARRRAQTRTLRLGGRVARQARGQVQGRQGPPQVPVCFLATRQIVSSAPYKRLLLGEMGTPEGKDTII